MLIPSLSFTILLPYTIVAFQIRHNLIPKGPQCPKRAFLILGKLPKLDNRSDSCEILHDRVLPRVLANKTIFIENT